MIVVELAGILSVPGEIDHSIGLWLCGSEGLLLARATAWGLTAVEAFWNANSTSISCPPVFLNGILNF
jgi:hypothetical protein